MMRHIDLRYGPEARNRLAEPATPTAEGAHAAPRVLRRFRTTS
jgi:hypothetical protein